MCGWAQVVAYMSQIDEDPDIAVEIFVLEPEARPQSEAVESAGEPA